MPNSWLTYHILTHGYLTRRGTRPLLHRLRVQKTTCHCELSTFSPYTNKFLLYPKLTKFYVTRPSLSHLPLYSLKSFTNNGWQNRISRDTKRVKPVPSEHSAFPHTHMHCLLSHAARANTACRHANWNSPMMSMSKGSDVKHTSPTVTTTETTGSGHTPDMLTIWLTTHSDRVLIV